MSYTVDYSGDYAHVDGVESGTYMPPGGAGQGVNAKQGTLTRRDIQGGAFGVVPTDVPFVVWGITGKAEVNGTLVVDSVTYTVIGATRRGDAAQQRLICREQV